MNKYKGNTRSFEIWQTINPTYTVRNFQEHHLQTIIIKYHIIGSYI